MRTRMDKEAESRASYLPEVQKPLLEQTSQETLQESLLEPLDSSGIISTSVLWKG